MDERRVGRTEIGEPHFSYASSGENGPPVRRDEPAREALQELLERFASGKHARQIVPPGTR